MKKYQELELKIKELQKEVDRLKLEEKEEYLPYRFDVKYAIDYLKNQNKDHLGLAFEWIRTPQGFSYWNDFYQGRKNLTDEAIIQIQKWIIIALQKGQN